MKFVDHYIVLGLPTGEEGTKLTERQITKSFKAKALEVHPDKRPGDQAAAAHSDFQKLKESYRILMDFEKRQEFDAILLAHLRSQGQQGRRTRSFQVVRKEDTRGTKRRNVKPDFEDAERNKRQAIQDEKKLKNMMLKISGFFAELHKILKEDDEKEARSETEPIHEPKP